MIVESCYFLDAKAKVALLNWVQCGGINVVDVPVSAYSDIAQSIEKYADHEIDFTDATLIWLANNYQQQQIFTVRPARIFSLRVSHAGLDAQIIQRERPVPAKFQVPARDPGEQTARQRQFQRRIIFFRLVIRNIRFIRTATTRRTTLKLIQRITGRSIPTTTAQYMSATTGVLRL